MGIYSSAELVFGILVDAYERDDDGFQDRERPTRYMDITQYEGEEDYVDWKYGSELQGFSDPLKFDTFGHYQYGEERMAILTHKDVRKFNADPYEATKVEAVAMTQDQIHEANEELKRLGWGDLDFEDGEWYLVCSVG